ncbi:MAG: NAD(P)H-dependent flavin oxidoreductase [Myxococcales bacterium]
MSIATEITARLKLTHPIVQAPMAGGGDTPRLVAAVSEAGGLGSVGAAYLNPQQIGETGRAVRSLTSRPFGINLFAPQGAPRAADARRSLERVAPFFAELGLPAPASPSAPVDAFMEQVAACLEIGASVFSFTLGTIPGEAVRMVKDRGLLLAGTATTVDEAIALEKLGVDLVVAQGSEAGGHRGTFPSSDFDTALVGTIALVPQIRDAVRVPVIASGGIMDGRGIAAALALGASAVQMGTAFLACDESGAVECYKQALLAARDDSTRVTRAFSGRQARGIVNRFMQEMERDPGAILPFPLQNALTRPLRTAAAKAGRTEFLSLWAGQGTRMARRLPAAELVARLASETEAAIASLSKSIRR